MSMYNNRTYFLTSQLIPLLILNQIIICSETNATLDLTHIQYTHNPGDILFFVTSV